MTITVTPDIAEGTSFAHTSGGVVATRVFKVLATAGETLREIIVDPAIPQYGELHPYTSYTPDYMVESFAAVATNITVRAEGNDPGVFIVTANYEMPSPISREASEDADQAIIRVGSTVAATKTQKDKTGAQIVVALTGQPNQVGEVDVQVAETVIEFERKESASPTAKAAANVGFVNSVTVGGYSAKTLLCLGILGDSSDGGQTWMVRYSFQYRPTTWAATIVYIDPETDRPHNDINLSTSDGVEVVDVYSEVDFTALDLPW